MAAMAAVDYIENPRKVPRVMVSVPVGAVVGQDRFDSSTVDLGPRGCQLVVPRPHPRGTLVSLVARHREADASLQANGIVAWTSAQEPYRMGVAFGESSRAAATTFFDQVVAARPALAGWRQVPTRLPLEASVWLARPPTRLVDFTPDEVATLRAVGSGSTMFELRARLRDRWSTAHRSVFSLLASGFITLALERSVAASEWSALLNRLEAEIALESLDDPMAGLAAARDGDDLDEDRPGPALGGHRGRPTASDGAAGLDLDPELLLREPEPTLSLATAPTRTPEAEAAYRRALVELEAGRSGAALTQLRQALSLAPGDAEIAERLGETAFRAS